MEGGDRRGNRLILRLLHDSDGLRQEWQPFSEDETDMPTLRLSTEAALALSEALSGLRTGAEEYQALRADYEAERKRGDRILEALLSSVNDRGLR